MDNPPETSRPSYKRYTARLDCSCAFTAPEDCLCRELGLAIDVMLRSYEHHRFPHSRTLTNDGSTQIYRGICQRSYDIRELRKIGQRRIGNVKNVLIFDREGLCDEEYCRIGHIDAVNHRHFPVS